MPVPFFQEFANSKRRPTSTPLYYLKRLQNFTPSLLLYKFTFYFSSSKIEFMVSYPTIGENRENRENAIVECFDYQACEHT